MTSTKRQLGAMLVLCKDFPNHVFHLLGLVIHQPFKDNTMYVYQREKNQLNSVILFVRQTTPKGSSGEMKNSICPTCTTHNLNSQSQKLNTKSDDCTLHYNCSQKHPFTCQVCVCVAGGVTSIRKRRKEK